MLRGELDQRAAAVQIRVANAGRAKSTRYAVLAAFVAALLVAVALISN
jgi:hypothetical protein